jgi:hypothetical protein
MGVWLTRGDGDGDMCLIRKHPHCTFMTDWWWGDGCIPVCFACATLDEVTHASLEALCKRDGWGPIPTENTDRDYTKPRPRVLGEMSNKKLAADVNGDRYYVVDVGCSNCDYVHHTAFAHWTAIGCPCGTDLARSERWL